MLATARERFLTALQYRDYRTLWMASVCSGAAAWALIVARGWLAFQMTDSSFWVGLVTFMAMAPRFFATPITGFLADRFDRRTLLSLTYVLELANNAVLGFLTMAGLTTPWILVILSLTNGTLRASQMTASQALVPNLIPRQHLMNAVALNEATQQGSRFVGPLAIAPLLGFVNVAAAFWLCSALYGVGLVLTLRIATRSTGDIDRSRSFGRNFAAGFVYVYQHPLLLALVLLALGHCSLTMSYESMLPVISQDKLQAGSVGVSLMIAGVGAGALVTAIFVAGVRNQGTRGWLFLLFGITSGLGPIGMALSSSRELSILAAVAMGVNQAGFMVITHTIIQSIVPDAIRGRVSGVYSMHVGGSMAVANLTNGTLADVFNAPVVMAVGGIIFTVAIVLSIGQVTVRRIYFPRVAASAPAA
jgi:MFS family permease